MRDFFQDIRYTLRLLGRAPAFTAIAVATLALGIGANTAIFAVVNAVLLKPLPFADAERLMLVHMLVPERERPGVYNESVWSYPKYRTFTASQQVFDEIAFFAGRDLDLSGDGEPQRVRGEVVTERYPSVLGVAPLMGRPFTWDEVHTAGTPPAAMISHGLWTRRFGADPAVVGRTIRINATQYTVTGVLPRGFRGLIGNADVWVPLAAFEPSQLTQAQSHSYTIVARRKHDVSEQTAASAVEVLGRQVHAAYPRKDTGDGGMDGARQLHVRVARRYRRPPGGAGAARRGRLRAADRVREPDESRRRQGDGAPPRGRRPRRDWRQPRTDRAAVRRRGGRVVDARRGRPGCSSPSRCSAPPPRSCPSPTCSSARPSPRGRRESPARRD